MYTSYFAKTNALINAGYHPISISGRAPEWFNGPQYKVLAPKYSFFNDYKEGIIGYEDYTKQFFKLVLEPLDALTVYNFLLDKYGNNTTLCCYEKPGDFCHRHLVAWWLEQSLDIEIPEIKI